MANYEIHFKLKTKIFITALAWIAVFSYQNARASQNQEKPQVLFFLSEQKEDLVMVNLGADHGLKNGSVLKSFRYAQDKKYGLKIVTGKLKIDSVAKGFAVAQVIKDGSKRSQQYFEHHAGVMAGDFLELPNYKIKQILHTLPELNFKYSNIFEQPKKSPGSYELSDAGKNHLHKALAIFKDKKVSTIMIKGYTDEEGPAKENQIESYHRAQTVRLYLINELGFEPSRVVAVGMGEQELMNTKNTYDSYNQNRRITINAISKI